MRGQHRRHVGAEAEPRAVGVDVGDGGRGEPCLHAGADLLAEFGAVLPEVLLVVRRGLGLQHGEPGGVQHAEGRRKRHFHQRRSRRAQCVGDEAQMGDDLGLGAGDELGRHGDPRGPACGGVVLSAGEDAEREGGVLN